MARRKVIDLNADTTIKFGNPKKTEGALGKGSTFDGYYIGSKEVQSGMGPSILHVFQTAEGNVGVWGSAQLNAKLKGLNGFHVFIKYTNEIKVPKGTMKCFEVEFDDEDTIDVGGAEVNFRREGEEPQAEDDDTGVEAGAEDDGGDDADSDDADSDEGDSDADDAPAQTPPRATKPAAPAARPGARAASPEQQSKVNAILNKRK